MARTFALKVVGPEGVLAEGETSSLTLPGAAGSLGVQAGHEPWIVLLKAGPVAYLEGGNWKTIPIGGGVAEISGERTTVLAEAVGKPRA